MAITKRATILITFAAFGAVVGSHVGALPFLIANSEVSPFVFGVAGALAMVANILAMGLGGFLNHHTDHRSVMLLIVPILALLLGFALLSNSVAIFVLSFLLLNFGLGVLDLFMNAEASIVEHDLGRPVFSSFHGTAILFIAGFAIVSSIVSAVLAPWFMVLLAGAALMLAWGAIYTSIPHQPVEHDEGKARSVALPRRVLTFIGIATGLNVATELAAIQWAGQLLLTVAPELAAISGLGVAFYGLCGGTMRLIGDNLRNRFGDFMVLLVCLFFAIGGFVVLGLSPGFWPSVIAFAAVGAGLSLTFPCLFALAARLVPEARASAMGYVATVGGAPRIILPWVLGILAAQYSLGAVFTTCAFVAVAALAIIVLTFREAQALAHAK